MQLKKPANGRIIVLASMLLMVVFGSVHAFSVFLLPMEVHFQTSRSDVSLIYSLALVALTFSVFLGHKLYGLVRPSYLVLIFCLLAFVGLVITAFANHILMAYLGFGLIFGFANGLAYGFCLHICAQTNQNSKGLAIGSVTASYALGPVLAPWPLTKLIESYSLSASLLSFAIAVLAVMPIAFIIFHKSGVHLSLTNTDTENLATDQHHTSTTLNKTPESTKSKNLINLLWLSYGLAVTAGLMSIGHATGIATVGSVPLTYIVISPIIIALFNMVGSLLGGWMVDHFKPRIILCILPFISAVSLLALSQFLSDKNILIGLAIVGFAYGAIIAAYPAVISTVFGVIKSIRIYGMIFTAWGAAGFLGPWLAGLLFDIKGDYNIALIIAAAAGLLSSVLAFVALKDDKS